MLAAGALGAPAAAHAERPLTLGLVDSVFSSPDPQERADWLDRAHADGAQVVRLNLSWAAVAPTRPAMPTDPADPAYRWTTIDDAVVDATARGLRVLLSINGAPGWAQAGHRRSTSAWRPNPTAFGAFAEAAARRYSGAFPDPRRIGTVLPTVRAWQAWNEPNLSTYLAPQWRGKRASGAVLYRSLLNAFYRGVKTVSRANLVVTAGTAPYGDPPGGARTMPVRFWREVLCVRREARCEARFDVLAHHPYAVAGPWRRALNADDVAVPDMAKLRRVLREAHAGSKRIWVTEISWDARPPDPDGVPAKRHARWLAEALYVLWRQGVDTVLWFQVRDQAPIPSFGATNQSGLHERSGAPRAAARAFSFPFVARRRADGRVAIWGMAPQSGTVTIEGRTRSGWRQLRTLPTDGRPFQAVLGWRGKHALRARTPTDTSLSTYPKLR